MPKVFISYRREDAAGYAQAIFGQLERHLRRDQIFMDVDTVEPGVDFLKRIEQAVSESEIVIALIGKRWMGERENAPPRIQDSQDFVHLEIATALSRNIRVIPVLVEGASMPSVDGLPPSLQPLVRRHALELSNRRFSFDLERVSQAVQKALVRPSESTAIKWRWRPQMWHWGVSVVVITLGIAVGLWFKYGQQKQTVPETIAQFAPVAKEQRLEQERREGDARIVDDPLGRAKGADNALRPAAPVEDNATRNYREVLKLDAKNRDAQLGLKRIGERYLALAQEALSRREFDKVTENVEKAAAATPDHPALVDLRGRLAERRREAQIKMFLDKAKAAEEKLTGEESPKRILDDLEELRKENARIKAENELQQKQNENLQSEIRKFQAEISRVGSDDRISDKVRKEKIESLKKQIKDHLQILLTK